MADLEALKRKRARAKAAITRLESFVHKNKTNTSIDCNEFIVRETQLVRAFEKYCEIQDEIEDESDDECTDRVEIESKYLSLCSLIISIVGDRSQKTPAQSSAPQQQTSSASGSSHHSYVKLPSLDIPTFTGKFEDYPPFRDLFSALIDSNNSISNAQKLMYLKSVLKNEPLDPINNLSITNQNYAVAMQILKDRFDKRLLIINSHLKGLLEVPQLTKNNNAQLRNFITQIKKHLESLKALEVPTDNWDLLLIFLYSKQLDFNTRQVFELERDSEEVPALREFLGFLDKRCSTFETLSSSSCNSDSKFKSSKVSYHSSEHSDAFKDNSNFLNCLYCKQKTHSIYKCEGFLKIPTFQRKHFVVQNRMCFNCLGSKHRLVQCPSKSTCRQCNSKHHTLLHDTYPKKASEQNATPSRSDSQTQVSHDNNSRATNTTVADSAQASSNSESCLIAQTRNENSQILLATAKVVLMAENGNTAQGRAILDSSSQPSFIT